MSTQDPDESKLELEPEPGPELEAELEAELETQPEPESDPETQSETQSLAEPEAEPEPEPAPVPDLDTLDRIAEPAVVRRAPKFGAFIGFGAVLGAVLGWLVAVLVRVGAQEARSAVIGLSTVGLACLGALIGAAWAALADRRSQRQR